MTYDPWKRWLYSTVDYSALELATLSQCCTNLGFDCVMRDAINAKQDLHVRMASRVLGDTYENTLKRYKAKEPVIVDIRQSMKPVNYGLGGLMGPPKLCQTARKDGVYFCEGMGKTPRGAEPGDGCRTNPRRTDYGKGRANRKIPPTCEVCLEQAAWLKELWYQEFPCKADYHACTIEVARLANDENQPLESFGTGMLRLERSANACSNHYFQNLAAQGAKNAAWLISKESYTDRRSVLFNNFRLAVFLHDETFGEVREPVAHECAHRQSELMIEGMKQFVPDVLIEAPPALVRRWFKGADAAWTRDGRLKPWWPVDPKCKQWPVHVPGCKCWKWAPDQMQMGVDLAS